MKKWSERAKGLAVGILLMALLSGTVVMASPSMREVVFGVRVSHNGNMVSFDVDSQPFIMDGRTFLPVRTIADIAGLHVDFVDGVVILSDTPITPVVVPQPTPVQTPAPQTQATRTASQTNAIRMAESYIGISAFSRSGLISQLEFEGFSNADATYGVDNISVNWYEQAARMAQSYLDMMPMSLSGLIQQLEFEGFTRAQAEHGATMAGL